MQDMGYFSRFLLQVHFGIDSQSLVTKLFFSIWCRQGSFLMLMGYFMTCFVAERGGQRVFVASAVSQMSQNDQ